MSDHWLFRSVARAGVSVAMAVPGASGTQYSLWSNWASLFRSRRYGGQRQAEYRRPQTVCRIPRRIAQPSYSVTVPSVAGPLARKRESELRCLCWPKRVTVGPDDAGISSAATTRWCNGNTRDFGSLIQGSSPCRVAFFVLFL